LSLVSRCERTAKDLDAIIEAKAQQQKISMRCEAKCKTEEALKVFNSNVVKRLAGQRANRRDHPSSSPAPPPLYPSSSTPIYPQQTEGKIQVASASCNLSRLQYKML
jgi:hypothetical protein